MTLLMTDEVPGLQVCADKARPAGERVWLDVEPRRGHFVVNLGEMLERWSNGLYNANLHRVVNASGRERYSVPFFYDGDADYEVTCIPTCLKPGEEPKYAPITIRSLRGTIVLLCHVYNSFRKISARVKINTFPWY